MRSRVIAAGLLLLAGCIAPADPPGGAREGVLVPERFDDAGEPWALARSGGCGFCMGLQGFAEGETNHHALFLHPAGRVVLIEYNAWSTESGRNATHVAEGITYDAAQLDAMVRATDRGAAGDVWIVRVTTARATEDGLAARLGGHWRAGSGDIQCTDTGMALLRAQGGAVERLQYTCGPSDPSMAVVSDTLWSLTEAARTLPATGMARP